MNKRGVIAVILITHILAVSQSYAGELSTNIANPNEMACEVKWTTKCLKRINVEFDKHNMCLNVNYKKEYIYILRIFFSWKGRDVSYFENTAQFSKKLTNKNGYYQIINSGVFFGDKQFCLCKAYSSYKYEINCLKEVMPVPGSYIVTINFIPLANKTKKGLADTRNLLAGGVKFNLNADGSITEQE